jgi:hypothetical protein
MERPRRSDDMDLPLPALDGDSDEEASDLSLEGQDLDLDTLADEEEVGLDTADSADDVLDPLELISPSEAAENEKWTEGTESAGTESASNLDDSEDDLVEGEEDGWAEESEPPEGEDWELEDLVSLPAPAPNDDDKGEEGVVERPSETDQDDETGLPPLDPSEDEEAPSPQDEEAFGLELLDEIADKQLVQEESDEE